MTATDTTLGDAATAPNDLAATGVRKITLPWHRLALGAVLLTAAFLNFYQLAREGYANSYYAAAVKSMSLSWHNFFFNSFDPGGFVTIDKPPLGFWFQVASVKLFGYNGVSLLLPEGLAGVLSVALLYYLVQRVFGRAAGLLSALILALTPVAVADNRNNTIDSILVLFMLLGAWAVSRAVEQHASGASRTSGLRWLLLCAVLVGLGFNIKMLEAYLVVPAFALVYLLGAQVRWRTRLIHLVLAAVVMLTVSLSWAVAVDLTPASQRPWVDSTTTNSEIDLAIGYNGLERLLGRGGGSIGAQPRQTAGTAQQNSVTGTTQRSQSGTTGGNTPSAGATQPANGSASTAQPAGSTRVAQGTGGGPGGSGGPGGLFDNGPVGPFRLLDSELGGQAGWLLPMAVIALLVAGSRRSRFPLDRQKLALLLWGTWLLTMAGFFSVAGFFHSYYLVTVAPAVAALAGIGLVALWQDYLQHISRGNWRAWTLPAALLVTALAQVYILNSYPDWSRWLSPLVLGLTLVALLVLVAARIRPRRTLRLWTPIAAAIGTLALLIAPTVWAADTIGNGGAGIPSAGPTAQGGNGFGRPQGAFEAGGFPGGPGPFGESTGGGTPGQPLAGAASGQPPAGFPSGQQPAGARSGQSPTGARSGQPPTNAGGGGGGSGVNTQLLRYLEKHQGSTYYLFATTSSNSAAPYIIQTGKPVMSLGGFSGSDPILTVAQFKALVKNNTVHYVLSGGGQGGGSSVMQWVQTACTAVPSTAWQGTTTTTGSGSAATGSVASPTSSSQGFGGAEQLYNCAGA